MDAVFRNVVERIFSNWTALKLAVDHSMGGSNSKQVAVEVVNYMAQYCISNDQIQTEDIQEALEDIMDEEFDTVCEDDSPKEIAHALHRFARLLKDNNETEFQAQFNSLPELKEWLTVHQPSQLMQLDSSSDEDLSAPSVQITDTEWTQVKSKRKR